MPANFEDWLAISETKARYCRFVDAKDWAGYADCFVEDLVFDITPMGGGRYEGRDAAVAAIQASVDGARTAHHVHNPEMRFDADGKGADVIWAMQDRVQWIDKPAPYGDDRYGGHFGLGHYHERYVKCPDGRWRIASVKLTNIFLELQPRS